MSPTGKGQVFKTLVKINEPTDSCVSHAFAGKQVYFSITLF